MSTRRSERLQSGPGERDLQQLDTGGATWPPTQVPRLLVLVGVVALLGCGVVTADRAAAASSLASATAINSTRAGGQPAALGEQLIVVNAPAYHDTYATLTAYDVSAGHRHVAFGPWTARIGYNGFAPPGHKREGDGRTPSGTYGIQFMFGVDRDPGVHYAYRRVHSYDVWDDDPSSPLYNQWVDERTRNPGESPEAMDQAPAYDYGAVIAYNTAHTPGLGSAIFLHVGVGGATIGCVSLPTGELLDVLRWLDPARSPLVHMGVGVAGDPVASAEARRLAL